MGDRIPRDQGPVEAGSVRTTGSPRCGSRRRQIHRARLADEVREHGLKERTVVIEFPTYEQAVAAYESDAYKKALGALGDAVERDLRIVRGAE